MTIRTEPLYFLTCDTCGTEHHDPNARDAMSARIAAGIEGWRYRSGGQRRKGQAGRRSADFCSHCEPKEPHELDSPKETR